MLVEELINRFEREQRLNPRLSVKEFFNLNAADHPDLSDDQRNELLFELVAIDLEFRWKGSVQATSRELGNDTVEASDDEESGVAHQGMTVEKYLEEFPGLASNQESLVNLIVEEFRARLKGGDHPTLGYYACRFPDLAVELDNRLCQVLDDWGRESPPVEGDAGRRTDTLHELPRHHQSADDLQIVSSPVELRILTGPHANLHFHYGEHASTVVGRSVDCQISLNKDKYFSRYHFRLEIKPPVCHLVDLDSKNGTYVNGEKVKSIYLRNGDRITGGQTEIVVRIPKSSKVMSTKFEESTRAIELDSKGSRAVLVRGEFAGYDIVEKLGKGNMGVVYLARNRSTDEQVALKVLAGNLTGRDRAMQMFLREASLLSQLKHPRIVRFVEIGMHEGQAFLAMEYVPSIDFIQVLSQKALEKRIRPACGITRYVLEGLEYAHARDIVHRDIKPANILVIQKGRKVGAKLADFGLAKNFMNAGLSGITQANETKGTLAFIAPEQLIDCRMAKPAADIYSVGMCLYTYLCAQSPFEGGSFDKLKMAKILNDGPEPLTDRIPEIPSALAAIVARAIARDPMDRYSSAGEMRQDLYPFTLKDDAEHS